MAEFWLTIIDDMLLGGSFMVLSERIDHKVVLYTTCMQFHELLAKAVYFHFSQKLKPKYSFGKWWKWKISLMGIVHKSCMSSQSPVNLFVWNHQFS